MLVCVRMNWCVLRGRHVFSEYGNHLTVGCILRHLPASEVCLQL